jgi:hypothetical protein
VFFISIFRFKIVWSLKRDTGCKFRIKVVSNVKEASRNCELAFSTAWHQQIVKTSAPIQEVLYVTGLLKRPAKKKSSLVTQLHSVSSKRGPSDPEE